MRLEAQVTDEYAISSEHGAASTDVGPAGVRGRAGHSVGVGGPVYPLDGDAGVVPKGPSQFSPRAWVVKFQKELADTWKDAVIYYGAREVQAPSPWGEVVEEAGGHAHVERLAGEPGEPDVQLVQPFRIELGVEGGIIGRAA
jgi:hypothetical protein